MKLGIRGRILWVALGVPAGALAILALISLHDIQGIARLVSTEQEALSATVSDLSSKALKDQARQDLMQLAVDQASVSEAMFQQVESEVRILVSSAEDLWARPDNYKPRRSYSRDEPPADPEQTTVCKLAPGVDPADAEAEIRLTSALDDAFGAVCAADPNVTSVYMGTLSGFVRVNPWMSRDKLQDDYDHRLRGWYQGGLDEGRMGWTGLYVDAWGGGLMVTCYCPVRDGSGQIRAVIGADVILANLNERIISTQVGETGFAVLVDEDGHLVADQTLTEGHAVQDVDYRSENLLESDEPGVRDLARRMAAGETGVGQCLIGGEDRLLAFAPLRSQGWSLAIVKPIEEITAPAQAIRDRIAESSDATASRIRTWFGGVTRRSAAIALLITVLVLLLGLRLSTRILKPVRELREGVRQVGNGDLDHRLTIRTGDELEELAETFNRMALDLQTYIRDLAATTAAKERMESELKIAREIQMSMLPRTFPAFPERDDFDIFASIEPAREVGGDFYDFFMLNDTRLVLAIGDVSDKGIPAALFMAATRSFLRSIATADRGPAEILAGLNRELNQNNDACMFVTMIVAIVDVTTGMCRYSAGGHPPPILLERGSDPAEIPAPPGYIVGAVDEAVFAEEEIRIDPGQILYFYTDGVSEAADNANVLFGEDRLMEALASEVVFSARHAIEIVGRAVARFTSGAEQSDDITMMAFQFMGAPTEKGTDAGSSTSRT